MTVLANRIRAFAGPEMAGPGFAFVAVVLFFSVASPQLLSRATFGSVAFQLPELGLFTLAMLLPVLPGGLNLAITFTANIAGLTAAWILQQNGGVDAGPLTFALACIAAVAVGAASGLVMGLVIAYTRAHPFLSHCRHDLPARTWRVPDARRRRLGFPTIQPHGKYSGFPIPCWSHRMRACRHVFVDATKLRFNLYMIAPISSRTLFRRHTRKVLVLVYMSGAMCAIAGIMLARFNSVRVGHGVSYLLITVLACFGGVNPFGVSSRHSGLRCTRRAAVAVLWPQSHGPISIWPPLSGVSFVTVMILRFAAGISNHQTS